MGKKGIPRSIRTHFSVFNESHRRRPAAGTGNQNWNAAHQPLRQNAWSSDALSSPDAAPHRRTATPPAKD